MHTTGTHAPQGSSILRAARLRILAPLLAVILVLTGLTTFAPTANAATSSLSLDGINVDVNWGTGNPPVLDEGSDVTFKVQYDRDADGNGPFVVALPDALSMPVGPFAVPPRNDAVESLVVNADGTLTVTFKSTWPGDTNQGVFEFKAKVDSVTKSEVVEQSWSIKSKNNGPVSKPVEVIVKNDGDVFEDVANTPKSKTGSGNGNAAVSVNKTTRKISVDTTALAAQEFSYTVTMPFTGARTQTLADKLPAGMSYVSNSFSYKVISWDADGLNRTVSDAQSFAPPVTGTAAAGQGFSTAINGAAKTVIVATYKAKITDPAVLNGIEAQLQAQYDAVDAAGGYDKNQWLNVLFENAATIDGTTKKASVEVGTNHDAIAVPATGTGAGNFAKTANWKKKNVDPDADGVLDPALEVEYTLRANLKIFNEQGDTPVEKQFATLGSDVIITDTLTKPGVSWRTDRITAPIGFSQTLSCFVGTQPTAGQWCITADRKTFMANVGSSKTTDATFKVTAQISSVDGLDSASTNVAGATATKYNNQATFTWSNAWDVANNKPERNSKPGAEVVMVDRPNDTDSSFNDKDTFEKTGPTKEVTVSPGQSTKLDYSFTVNGGNSEIADQEVDVRNVKIVDVVNTEIFDLSDLPAIKADLSGNYNGTNLLPADFDVSLNADGHLVIELSAAGKLKAATVYKKLTVKLKLPTKVVAGKQTIEVENTAELQGSTGTTKFWSESTSSLTSFGSEAEVRKTIRSNGAWKSGVRAQTDSEGGLIEGDKFVYRIQFIPHGDYKNVTIRPVLDVLPTGVEFLGFLNKADVDAMAPLTSSDTDMGGNVKVTWDANAKTVKLVSNGQNNLQQGVPIEAFVAVKVVAAEVNVPIVNKIGQSSATITPVEGDVYPIDIAKLDSLESDSVVIDDPSAKFQLLNADDEVVVDNIFVKDGALRVRHDGKVQAVVVDRPGTYTLREVNPPVGYVWSDRELTITVEQDEVPASQTFYNDPVSASVSVGNYVWIDKNHDGLQDDSDVPVEGVILKITGPDGNPVTGVNGLRVENQTTDEEGQYLFTGLPVLTGNQKYTVTIVDMPAALADFVPTKAGPSNGSGANDSSTDSAVTVGDLTTGGAMDLTLDFGFVHPYVSLGDYVWIDVNRDGLQDGTDVPVSGVKLEVFGPDGVKITHDIYGDAFDVRTNTAGKYLFDNLPVLTGTDVYTVKIDRTDAQTTVALKGLAPTTEGPDGGSGAVDSSDWEATSTPGLLNTHQAHDQKLDFGFIRQAVSVGNFVWEDVDRDGIQGDIADEPGIEGVLLRIYGPDGDEVTTDVDGEDVDPQVTDENGHYEFTNLPALPLGQSYTVKIDHTAQSTQDALKPFVPTTPGANNGEGSNDSSTNEAVSTEDLSEDGSADETLDFGFVKKYVSVGDYVWIDKNRNGTQDSTDVPVKDVELKIELVTTDGADVTVSDVTDVLGKPVGTTLTNDDGHYEFSMLPVLKVGQEYRVTIIKSTLPTALDNYIPTEANVGNDLGIDSDDWTSSSIDKLDGTTVPTTPKDSAHVGADPTLDFGFVEKLVSVGNKVWIDTNEDGVRDPSEKPLEGVTLVLTDPDGNPVVDVYGEPVLPVVTNDDGDYLFKDLPALPSGKHYTVTVDYDNSPILEELNLVPTNPGVRGDDTDPLNDYSHIDSAESGDLTDNGDHDPTLDFGFRNAKVSVGNYVWIDVNRDGLQDSSDIAIKGVVLKLTGPDGLPVVDVFGKAVEPFTTDEKGHYLFKDLPVLPKGKSYTVTIDKEASKDALKGLIPTTAGAGSDKGKDSSTSSATSHLDLSKDKSEDLTLDFGFLRPRVSVGDYVWLDTDRDGIQDKKEPGIGGVVVKITGPDGKPVVDVNGKPVGPQTTDKDGHYLFTDLPVLPKEQSYTVKIDKKASKKALKGLTPTVAEAGKNRAKDSSLDQASSDADLSVNEAADLTLDFGFYTPEVENSDVSNGNGVLPDSGAAVSPWMLAAGVLLLLAGLGLVLRRRREV